MKRYYTVKETSKILGLSTNTIYKYLNNGLIKGRRIGKGRFKIPKRVITPYLGKDSTKPTSKNKILVLPKLSNAVVISVALIVSGVLSWYLYKFRAVKGMIGLSAVLAIWFIIITSILVFAITQTKSKHINIIQYLSGFMTFWIAVSLSSVSFVQEYGLAGKQEVKSAFVEASFDDSDEISELDSRFSEITLSPDYEYTSNQDYLTVFAKLDLPSNFLSWAYDDAMAVDYATETTLGGDNTIDIRAYLENSSLIVFSTIDETSRESGQWTKISFSGSDLDDGIKGDWNKKNQTIVVYLKMKVDSGSFLRAGDITLNYFKER